MKADDVIQACADEQRRLIVESSENGMLVVDAFGTIEIANLAAERLMGYTPLALVGQHVEILASAELSAAVASMRSPTASFDPLSISIHGGPRTARCADGRTVPLEITTRTLTTGRGPLLLVSVYSQDVVAAPHARQDVTPVKHQDDSVETDDSHGGYWRLDVLGQELFWSEDIYRIYGRTPGERPTVEDALAAFEPADRDRVAALVERAIVDGTSYRDEARIIRPDGSMRDVVHGGRVEHGPDGSVVALTGFFQDVTERKNAERERQRLNSYVMLANQAGKIGIWELDLRTNVSVWDRNMYALYGIDDPTLVPTFELWQATLHPHDREVAVRQVKTDLAGGVPSDTEFRVIWQTGEVHHIRSLVTAVLDAAGVATRVIGTDWDVTEIRSLAEQLREEKDLLINSEARYRALTEAMPQMVWVIDAVAQFEYVNWRWSEYTGLSLERSRLLGLDCVISSLDGGDVSEKRMVLPPQEFECEARLRRRDGSYRWHLMRSVPFHDATGDTGKWITTATDIEERKAAEWTLAATVAKLEHVAHHDPLTNLPNRKLLLDRLAQAIAQADRAGTGVIVLYVDLDRFKAINDTLGHAAGDCVLKETGMRIGGMLRVGDTASRVGGDEFIIVCATSRQGDDITYLATRLLEAVTAPIDVADEQVSVEASIGISVYPADGVDADTLIRKADVAMYSAKQNGRNSVRRYSNEAHHSIVAAGELEAELRHGIAAGELVIHYQPIVDLRQGRAVAAEALVRWQHPRRGLLPPGEFIAFAEERGLVAQIGDAVLDGVCAMLARLGAGDRIALTISVNVSAHQFSKPGLVESIVTALRRHAVDPRCLEIEITESVVMGNSLKTIATLDELRALGVTLAIDDFGTGYSSLAYIKKFPISTLKIDRSFVRDIADDTTDQAIAKTIITLAHSLNMNVIAEGVETHEQLNTLRSFGVDRIQGYLLSRPLTGDAFGQFIETFPSQLPAIRPLRRIALRAALPGVAARGTAGRQQ